MKASHLSNPQYVAICFCFLSTTSCVMYKNLKNAVESTTSRLAQLVEHETLNLRVVGSSPTLGEHFIMKHVIIIFFLRHVEEYKVHIKGERVLI